MQSDLYAAGMVFHQLVSGTVSPCISSRTAFLDDLLGENSDRTLSPDAANILRSMPDSERRLSAAEAATAEPPATEVESATQNQSPPSVNAQAPLSSIVGSVGGPLDVFIRKMINRSPAERPESANAALRDLSAAVPYAIPIETAATRESFLQATLFIGRDAELANLRRAIERIKQDSGTAFLIGGESGVGKSRLLTELRTLALVHGCWVVDGQSTTDGGYYYQEWLPLVRTLCFRVEMTDAEAAILKDLVGDIGELLGRAIPDAPAVKSEAAQARIASTIAAVLKRQSRPLVLILEDLHWARSESLALLQQLSLELEKLPTLLIGTFRSDESPALPQSLPTMTLMPLQRLDPQNIARLSESMLGAMGQKPELVAYLSRQTEGNVFFLVEVVRALAENAGELQRIGQGELPETVLTVGIERIVERRLERVPIPYRPLLQLAAVLGRKFDLAVLGHAFPELPLRLLLIECANAAVLESQGSDWRFAHDKLREAILRQIPTERLSALHLQAAENIEAIYTAEKRRPQSFLLAYHLAQANQPERALKYYLQAAEDATTLCLYAEARACLSGALTVLALLEDTADHRRLRIDLLLRQIQTSLLTDKLDTQIERTAAAQKLLNSLSGSEGFCREDRLRNARLHYYLGRSYHYAGQPGEAIKKYQLVIPIAQEFGDQELLVLPAYVTGIALCMQGNSGKGCDLLGKAAGPMEGLGNAFEWLRGLLFYGLTLSASGRHRDGLEQMERAYAQAQKIGQPSVLAMCQLMFSALWRTAADWKKVAEAARLTIEHATKSGDKVYLFSGNSYLAWAEGYLGLHDAADEHRDRALAIAQVMGGKMIISDWFEAADGERAILAGQPELALARAQAVLKKSQPAGLVLSHGLAERVFGCAVGRLGGNDAEMDTHFQESTNVLDRGDNVLDVAHTQLWWGRLCLERGQRGRAREHFQAACEQYQRSGLNVARAELDSFWSNT